MKKIVTKMISMIMIFTILFCIPILAYASNDGSPSVDSFDEMKQKADSFIDYGKNKGDTISTDSLNKMVVPVARTMIAIATVVVSVVTVIMGIKYIMAAPDEKGKLKQQLIGLVVSTIVIFGAQGIWSLVYNFMNSVTK